MVNVTDAANAYTATAKQLKSALGTDDTAGGSPFGDLVKQSLSNAIDLQHKSETISGKALAGKADMTDVLQAVTDAQLALNTVIAVRDKVVQAYRDVMSTQM